MCKEFSVLPESGGLFDQHPLIVHAFMQIMQAQSELEKKKQHRSKIKGKGK